jgi:hypothetical protein
MKLFQAHKKKRPVLASLKQDAFCCLESAYAGGRLGLSCKPNDYHPFVAGSKCCTQSHDSYARHNHSHTCHFQSPEKVKERWND